MNNFDGTSGIAKLFAVSLLAVAANVPAHGVSAAQPPVKATCSTPDHLANLKVAYDPQYPLIAKEQGIKGSALVHVGLARSGAVQSATIAKSSGSEILDREALASARASKYEPETVSCQPVAGEYIVDVNFGE